MAPLAHTAVFVLGWLVLQMECSPSSGKNHQEAFPRGAFAKPVGMEHHEETPENVPREPSDEPEELPVPSFQKSKQSDEVIGYIRDDGTYVIEDSANTPCVMAYFKAKIKVFYPINRKEKKYENKATSPPGDVKVSGKCNRDSLTATLDLSWEKRTFSLYFAFDEQTDSWYVSRFTFAFDTSHPFFKGADKAEKVIIKSPEKKRFWTTNFSRSFRCFLLHDVLLEDEGKIYSGIIHFDEARVQALTKTSNFNTPKHCIHRVNRSEMVPVAVSGALVALTLLIMAAYGGFRYMKVKKFQYGTMQGIETLE